MTAVGVATALTVTLLVGQVAVARNRTYLIDVPFVVDARVGAPAPGEPPLALVVLGDSTAAGVGSDDEGSSLPVLLARRVAGRTGRAVDVMGLGRSGARTVDVRRDQVPRIDGADVVVILVGSNDVIHATAPWRLRDQTARLLEAATATGRPVVLGGIPRFAGVHALAQPLRAVVDGFAAVQRTAQRAAAGGRPQVTFVDIAATASPRFRGVPEAMSSDAFHPSTVGYGFWADALAPAVVAAANDQRRGAGG